MSNENGSAKDQTIASSAKEFAREEILGARQWRRSKIGSLTGFSSIIDAARSAKNQGGESVTRVSGLYGAAFGSDTSGKAIPDSIVDTRERFLMSMQRNGRTTQDIAKSVGVTYHQFWLYLGLVAATLVLAVLTFPRAGEIRGVADVLFALVFRLCPLPLLLALAVRAGWTNWCFRRFRLDGLRPYFKAGQAMLPRKSLPSKPASTPVPAARRGAVARIGMILALGLGAYLATMHLGGSVAMAQDSLAAGKAASNQVFVDPSRDDLFIKLLSFVVPNAGPIPANSLAGDAGPYKLIRDGLSLFAATLLFVGMLMSGWQIITGIVASAKEGTAIGRNYHEVWAPVRTVIGYGMLVPVANGLCGAQILCLYLIAWGGNLANIVWTPYVEKSVVTTTSTNAGTLAKQAVQTVGSTITDTLMQSILEKELCRATVSTMKVRGLFNNALSATIGAPVESLPGVGGAFNSLNSEAAPASSPNFELKNYEVVNYFNKNETHVADYGKICGTLEITIAKAAGQNVVTRTEITTAGLPTNVSMDTSFEDNRAHQLGMARLNAVKSLKTELAKFADKAARTYQVGSTDPKYFSSLASNSPAEIAQAKKDYLTTLESNITMNADWNTSPGSTALMDKMRSDAISAGWAKAGTYYLTLARMQSNLYSGLYGGIKSSPIDMESSSAVSRSLAEYLFGRDSSPGVIPQFRSWWASNIGAISQSASANLTKAGSNSVFDSLGDWSLWTASLFMHLDVNPLNPMGAMIEYGDFLMRTGFGIYLSIMAIQQGSTLLNMLSLSATAATGGAASPGMIATGIATISTAAFNAIATPLTMVAGAIIIAGAVHAYIIPMLPYIMTLFFVGGMLFLTVESLVAAPLWAFFHIRLDGQEFIDQVQKPGYMIAFNLLLRPVLMIFGLMLSLLTFGAMSWFVNETFMPVANGLASSTTVGPIGAAAMIVILAVINLNLASKAFHLITEIPDRVARWFGQGGEQLGEKHDMDGLKGAVLTAAARKGEDMISGAMTSRMVNSAAEGNKGNQRNRALATGAQQEAEGVGKGGGPGPEGKEKPAATPKIPGSSKL